MSPFSTARSRSFAGLALAGLLTVLHLGGCEGSGTQTTTGKGVEGSLVDIHGNPVDGAVIKALPVHFGPNRILDSKDSVGMVTTTTDKQGRYAIPELEVGIYNLIGVDAGQQSAVLIPRVKYVEQAIDLGTDTLRSVGAVIGQVTSNGIGIPQAFCYLEGSNYAAITDATGHFLLAGLPEGIFRLNYFAEGYARAQDSVLVRAGDTLDVPAKDLTRDVALQPPGPQNLRLAYDSIWGVVRLMWDSVSVPDFKEYVIEFQDEPQVDFNFTHMWTTPTPGFNDNLLELFRVLNTLNEPFVRTYWVRAKDWEGNISPKQQPLSVRIVLPGIFQTRFVTRALVDSASGTVCGDSLGFELDMQYSPDSLVEVQWYYAKQMVTLDGGPYWPHPYDPLDTTVGSPKKDTVYFTRRHFQRTDPSDTTKRDDSLKVVTQLSKGTLIHADVIDVALDSSGCYHAGAARRVSRAKPLTY